MRAVIRIIRAVRGEEGATLTEVAISCAVFLSMLFGTFEMMLVLYTMNYVDDAARQGTRYAIVRGSTSCTNTPSLSNCNATGAQIQTFVQSFSYPGINSGNLTLAVTWASASSTKPTTWTACATTCNAPGNVVKVVASYPYSLSIPFVPKATINLTSTSQMVISQ